MADQPFDRQQWGGVLLALTALLWVGMILGVSGLATPVKFEAPSLTLPVALEVGRVTFQTFNRVEWCMGLLLVVAAFLARLRFSQILLAVITLLIVMIQSAWLLPALDARVGMIVAGSMPEPSGEHLWYTLFEAAKIVLLLVVGITAMLRMRRFV